MEISFPEGPPGVHPPTSALARILAFKHVTNPVDEKPFSEALLLGVGGGLDTGYILFQFNHLPSPMLVLGFRNQWNNTRAFTENIVLRLNLAVEFEEFDNQSGAQIRLQEVLKQDRVALVWVDKAHLPYHEMPENLRGYINHQVAVYARDGRLWRLYLDDLSSKPIEVREKIFTAARANLRMNNFLMLIFKKARELNPQQVRHAILEGIRDCVIQLTQPFQTAGISNLTYWAEKLTNHHDRMGWPQVFRDQNGLYPALVTLYESIKLNGTEGFALRKLYSDFLNEAARLLDNPAFNAVAGQYLQLSNHWSNLAENALPSRIQVFDQVKKRLNQKYAAYREYDLQAYKKAINDLNGLNTSIMADFPLDDHETNQLYERLAGQIMLIAELEKSAALRLRDLTRP